MELTAGLVKYFQLDSVKDASWVMDLERGTSIKLDVRSNFVVLRNINYKLVWIVMIIILVN